MNVFDKNINLALGFVKVKSEKAFDVEDSTGKIR